MKHLLVICRAVALALLLLCVALSAGCSSFAMQPPSLADQRTAASAVGVAANEALPLLVAEYQRCAEGIVQLADTEADVRVKLAELDRRWNPVWQAHEAVELAQHSWARALDDGGDTDGALGVLEAAWCALQQTWPAQVSPLPLKLMGCKPEAP